MGLQLFLGGHSLQSHQDSLLKRTANMSKTTVAAPAPAKIITSGSKGSVTGSVVVVVVVVVLVVVVVDDCTVTKTVLPMLLPEVS